MTTGYQIEFILAGLTDSSGNPLSGGLISAFYAASSIPISLYTDKDCSVAASSPVVLDAQGRAVVYGIAGLYKFTVRNSSGSIIYTWDNVRIGDTTLLTDYPTKAVIQSGSLIYGGTSTGSANVQAITLTPSIGSLTTGMMVAFKAGYSSTAAWTLNVGGTGAVSCDGQVVADKSYVAIYDGTIWKIISPFTNTASHLSTTLINTTSTSFANMSTDATVDIFAEQGDRIILQGSVTCSHGSASTATTFNLSEGTTEITNSAIDLVSQGTATHGAHLGGALFAIVTAGTTGLKTFRIRWKTTAGTTYSLQRKLIAQVVKGG